MAATAAAAAAGAAAAARGGPDGVFEVIHTRVVLRASPSTKADMVSGAKKGDVVAGTPYVVGGQPWLRLDAGTCEAWNLPQDKTVEGVWVLIDGASVGLGELLRRAPNRSPPTPKAAPKAVMAKPKVGKEEAKEEAPKLPPPKRVGHFGEFIVVHDKVEEREEPRLQSKVRKTYSKSQLVEGTPHDVAGNLWLQMEGGWLLMDGSAMDKNLALCRPAEASSCKSAERAASCAVDGNSATRWTSLYEDDQWLSIDLGSTKSVARVEVRWEHACAEKYIVQGSTDNSTWTSFATEAGREGWVTTSLPAGSSARWVRILGKTRSTAFGFSIWDVRAFSEKASSLGKLVVPAADIAENVLHWAQQHSSGGTISLEQEEELLGIQKASLAQAEQLLPLCDHEAVLQLLVQEGFIAEEDVTLGSAGVVARVARALLRRRAAHVVATKGEFADKLPFSKQAFSEFLHEKALPAAPFHCRTVTPQHGGPKRVLVLFHGSLVRGDDLLGEAEVLQKLMPETAVLLPEGPVVANEAHGLRLWWPPPLDASNREPPADVREARDLGYLTAPELSIQRTLVTIKSVAARFKGLPIILGGFSQGAMLAAQSIKVLAGLKAFALPGLLLLSGLAAPFDLPSTVKCLAIHGDSDERMPLSLAEEVARSARVKGLKLEVVAGLAHAISDAVLDLIVRFCDEVSPVSRALVAAAPADLEEAVQEANQAKLLRWVKKVSQVITMFDDARFMSHIMVLDMPGLTDESPALGNGLVRYHLYDAGPGCRGLVVLFHGKIWHLRRDTARIAEAYRRLKLSVCVVDYRQKFSQFCVDATIVLEELDQIPVDTSLPVIIHAIGCGAIHGLHMAIASQAYPNALRQRLRMLVLDGGVGNFRSLPPSPTGCIATDPIGNDEKLQFVGMPLCILGGDDACCGLTYSQGHWTCLHRAAENLHEDGKLPELTLIPGTALVQGTGDGRLCPELFRAISQALESGTGRAVAAQQKFIADVLGNDSLEDSTAAQGFEKEELLAVAAKVLEAARRKDCLQQLWKLRLLEEPQRGQELSRFVVSVHLPILQEQGRFKAGGAGFQQFQAALTSLSDLSEGLAKARENIREAFDLRKLDRQVEKVQREVECAVSLEQWHRVMEKSTVRWESEEQWDLAIFKVKQAGGAREAARAAVKETGRDVNRAMAELCGLEGTDQEIERQFTLAHATWNQTDPSLEPIFHRLQMAIGGFTKKLTDASTSILKDQKAQALKEGTVEVVIEQTDGAGSITVVVPPSCTILDVRRAVMAKMGETKLSQVKLGMSAGAAPGDFQPIADEQILGLRRKLCMAGRSTAGKAELEIVVHFDRALGFQTTLRVRAGSKIRAIRQQLATEAGAADAEGLVLRNAITGRALGDEEPVSAELAELELSMPSATAETVSSFATPETAGSPVVATDAVAADPHKESLAEDLELVIHIDRTLGLQSTLRAKRGSPVRVLKEQLAEADPTGMMKPEDFSLRLPGGPPLADAEPITAEMAELDVCMEGVPAG